MLSAAPISGLRYFSGGRRKQRSVRIRTCRGHKVCDLCQVHGRVIEEARPIWAVSRWVAVAASGAGVFWTNSMSCLLCSLQWATREELRNCRGGGHPCVASVLATISMGKAPDRDSSQSGAHCSAGPCMQAPARVIAGCGSW